VFTQCAKCETIFKLSADVLRAAGGQVRCGRCGEVFNALARLAEDPGSFSSGESAFELETRADHILESASEMSPLDARSVAAPRDEEPPGIEVAQLLVQHGSDGDLEADALDGDLEAGALGGDEDIEAVGGLRADRGLAAGAALDAEGALEAGAALDAKGAPEGCAAREAGGALEAEEDPARRFIPPPGELDCRFVDDARHASLSTPAHEFGVSTPAAGIAAIGMDVSDDARRDLLAALLPAGPAPPAEDPARATRADLDYLARRGAQPRRRGAWLTAAGLLALMLGAQIIDRHREALAATMTVGPAIRAFYATFGVDLAPPPSLAAYQLRQWGVSGDAAAGGVLRVRASLLNATAQNQPYPLLRVSVADRFGTRIGTRDFQPAEYLGKPALGLLRAGERIDASIDILDPGKTAEGFEIDVCVRGAGHALHCQGDVTSSP
jgi:predicted Zn finger-like uncharacterized protein